MQRQATVGTGRTRPLNRPVIGIVVGALLLGGLTVAPVAVADDTPQPTWVCDSSGEGITFVGGAPSASDQETVSCAFTTAAGGPLDVVIETGSTWELTYTTTEIDPVTGEPVTTVHTVASSADASVTGAIPGSASEQVWNETTEDVPGSTELMLTLYAACAGGLCGIRATGTISSMSDAPSPPAGSAAILAGPFATTAGYAPPVTVMFAGSTLTFANGDVLAPHNVEAFDRDPVTRQPLFESAIIPAGQTTEVVGADALPPGSYDFFCILHPQMTGTLTVR